MIVKEYNKINEQPIIRYTSDSNKYIRYEDQKELYQEIILRDNFNQVVIETDIEIENTIEDEDITTHI